MIKQNTLFYTYLDECKKNFFTTEFERKDSKHEAYNFYSLSSVSFESDYYLQQFEDKWAVFKKEFNIPDKTCLHFAEYKKLLSSDHVKNIKIAIRQKEAIFSSESSINFSEFENVINSSDGFEEKEKEKLLKKLESFKNPEDLSSCYVEVKATFRKYSKKILSVDEKDIEGYRLFLNSDGTFDIVNVHNFFSTLKELLKTSQFHILNTDYINLKKAYLPLRKASEREKLTNPNILPAKNLAKAEARVVMKKHLDILIEFLISNNFNGSTYLDENLPDMLYTKLRFDADGKEFEAKSDLKMAFHECLTTGTERFEQKTAVKLLDEIRFIRKEEVGSGNIPPHCGSELVDFLCSLVCSETRVSYLTKIGVISQEDFPKGKYSTLIFEEEELEDISFEDIIEDKLFLKTMIDYSEI
ncbi:MULTISPECIES: hypothetical protein [unclassified Planococcus (in: firmicutes)]|uniref:hypothetical protein n=1 Tax=unclassified Planococcus (in: firmicutes) TaxID=2662419 RepID=UPI000C7E1EEF|nr:MULTISPECIES: hypothetical protein [unclassified Planococcus (in: firmicutes)]PKG48712.1 hypothetical protein CXF66_00220 [Planococcus sp. Urea-trap-24]PKG90854.1 hypothetical protein CXF91_03490 [Planococcus sp. Urea-3u-39]PKH38147.1 hypothetical protein CXF77_12630 [Planococcus sp. MB-3u-09]